MKQFLLLACFVVDNWIDRMGRALSWVTTILMLVICFDVIQRYFFNQSQTWLLELEWHLFSLIFLLGASYALLHNKHVRVDVFYERFSDNCRDWVNIIGVILFLVPWVIIIITHGMDYMLNSFSFKEGSPQPNGLPARYIIKSVIVIGFVLLGIQGLSIFLRTVIRKMQ